ncbi:MAG: rhodanese-like proteincyclic nucleotide-binding protein [Proteobacteria bacterium]|nr:rhodanese-like proteincyclic nucleotide-binding protein [Pseudomonadota bacterium]
MELTIESLGRLEPIRSLSPERLKELARMCKSEHHDIGTDPLRAINLAGQLIYLLRGELRITHAGGGAQLLVGGCDEANWPLGQKFPMPQSGKAITDLEILRIDSNQLDILMTWDQLCAAAPPPNSKAKDSTVWRTMSGIFHTSSLVGGALTQLPPTQIGELMLRFDRIKCKRGQVILRQGDEGDYYYVIETGRCEVTRQISGAELWVAELKAGDAFGEEALVAGERRNASVKMKTDGALWRLSKPDFVELLQAPLLKGLERVDAEHRVAEGKALWIDVRYPAEFTQDGLIGALNIPLNEIRNAIPLLDKDKEYITYCQSGRRSSVAAFLLAQRGLDACWLEGGLLKDKQ